MNRNSWRIAVVGGVMAIGLVSLPLPTSTNTWVAGPMISDPMDLNHQEAKAFHERWAAQVKAAREEVERKQAELVAESERKAAEAEIGARQDPAIQHTTPPRKAAPVQPVPPQPPRDEWMETFDYWSSVLPGTWAIEDKGSWGAGVPDTGQVWIARRTPLYALKSIMLHEAGHVMQGRAFGGYNGAFAALAPYGGLERTADCWAQARGATFLSYGCDNKAREGARLF